VHESWGVLGDVSPIECFPDMDGRPYSDSDLKKKRRIRIFSPEASESDGTPEARGTRCRGAPRAARAGDQGSR
jgi:hypothetical protein